MSRNMLTLDWSVGRENVRLELQYKFQRGYAPMRAAMARFQEPGEPDSVEIENAWIVGDGGERTPLTKEQMHEIVHDDALAEKLLEAEQ